LIYRNGKVVSLEGILVNDKTSQLYVGMVTDVDNV
jgi:hypothetical protein